MKKIFLVTLITLFAIVLFFVQCEKEDTSCACEDADGYVTIEHPSEFGTKTCKDLGPILTAICEFKITCKKQ